MDSFKTFTVNIGVPVNGGKPCKTPVVEYAGSENLLIECIDEARGIYRVEGNVEDNKCLTFIISCAECDDCGRREVTKCLCEGPDECGPCETCSGNVCVSLCTAEETCVDDTCIECNQEIPCTGGKVCKNNRCVCPTTAPFLVNGKCLECTGDGVKDCQRCVDGTLVPVVCSGACDPTTNQCVECLQASDCDGVNQCCTGKTCVCCPGFTLNPQTGDCEPTPDCTQDSDCGPCETCNDKKCDPVLCPDGKVCVGEEGCVDICSCTDPVPCNRVTDTCTNGVGGCGCVPCSGNCEDGCGPGCYCDGTRCIGDLCTGGKCPCTNGADCPPGYGCRNGQCVPCVTLDCENEECLSTPGCSCQGELCQGYPDIICTTTGDCPSGYTCYLGRCVPCSAFPCTECVGLSGCACDGANCVGTDEGCTDVFAITKNDEDCTLSATLQKTESCACGDVTAAILTRRRVSDAGFFTLDFKAEIRKGTFAGNLSALPLMDDLSSPDVVENDSPTSGTVEVEAVSIYRVFTINPDTGSRIRTSSGSQTQQVNGAFLTGTVSSLVLGEITARPPGTIVVAQRDLDDRSIEEWEYVNTTFTARITSRFDFPNTCTYDFRGVMGEWRVNTALDISNFGASYGYPRAKTITSVDTRLPVFRWFKSTSNVVTGAPFRKLYVPETDGAFVDIIDVPEGLEACRYYKVTTDCSCAPDPDIYAVFCNPPELEFDVDQCNRRITIDKVVPVICPVNRAATFYFRAGSVYKTWIGSQWPTVANTRYLSTSDILSVEYGQVCDAPGTCKKVYTVEREFGDTTGLQALLTPVCLPDATAADIFIPVNDTLGRCGLISVQVNGKLYYPNTTARFTPGTYTATITWACGCEPTTQLITISCCSATIPEISRDCQGVTACAELNGAIYSVEGVVIPAGTVCSYVEEIPRSEGRTLEVSINDCPLRYITIEPLDVDCCADFSVIGSVEGTAGTVTVLGQLDATLVVGPGSINAVVPTVTPLGGGVYSVSPLAYGNTYALTAVAEGCDSVSGTLVTGEDPNACTLDLVLNTVSGPDGSCILEANTDLSLCPCQQGMWKVALTNVRNTPGDTFFVDYTTRFVGLDAPEESSSGTITEVSTGSVTSIGATSSGSLLLQKVFTQGAPVEVSGTAVYQVVSGPSVTNVSILLGNLGTAPGVASITVVHASLGPITKVSPFSDPFQFNAVPTNPATQQFTVVVNFVDGSSQSFTDSVQVAKTATITDPFTISVPSRTEGFARVNFALASLVLEDACSYGNISASLRVKSNGSFFSGTNDVTLGMEPNQPNARKKKFVWTKDSVAVFEEYQLETSVLPSNFLEQGAAYRATAVCDPCTDSDTIDFCCPITVETESNACGNQVDVIINALPGRYTVALTGQANRLVTVPVSGSVRTVYTGLSVGTLTGYVEPQGLASCRENYTAEVVPPSVVALTFGAGTFTFDSFVPGSMDTDINYCLRTTSGTVATFTTATAPVGSSFPNASNGVVEFVAYCGAGTGTECFQTFEPSPGSCTGITVDSTITYPGGGGEGQIRFEIATGNVSCDVESIRITGGGIDDVYPPATQIELANGTYNFEVSLSCACKDVTGTFVILGDTDGPLIAQNTFGLVTSQAGCGTQSELEGTLSSGVPVFMGSGFNLSCTCDNSYTAEIVSVQEVGNDVELTLSTSLGANEPIGSSSAQVSVVGGGSYPFTDGENRIVLIPKKTIQVPGEDVDFLITTNQTYDNPGTSLNALIFEENFPFNQSRSMFTQGVTSATAIVRDANGTSATYNGTVLDLGGSRLQITFLELADPDLVLLSAFTVEYSIVSPTATFTDTAVIPQYTGGNSAQVSSEIINASTAATTEETLQSFNVISQFLTAANGCAYNTVTTPDFTVDSQAVSGTSSHTVALSNVVPVGVPRLKATWSTGGSVILEEYMTAQGFSTLEAPQAVLGSTYELAAECNECSETVTAPLCVNVTGAVTLSVCQDVTTFSFDIPQGVVYTVVFRGVSKTIARPPTGLATVSFNDPLTDSTLYVVTAQPQGAPACLQTFEFTTGIKDASC